MTDAAALQRLLTWLSPAFPVGAFAWSAGLETAIAERRVIDAGALREWVGGMLKHGSIRTDAIVLAHAWRIACGRPLHHASHVPPAPLRGGGIPTATPATADPLPRSGGGGPAKPVEGAALRAGPAALLADLAELCLALTPSAERHAETTLTGEAFVLAARAWPAELLEQLPTPCPYPVAVGAIAAAHGIGLGETLLAYLTAAVHAQISVAVRLVPMGQTDGLAVMAALEPAVAALAAQASTAPLDDVGGIGYAADIALMRHETLEPRIFRS